MTGKLYIDGNDAYTEYGAFVENDGYKELISYPALKAVKTNDWHEYNGVEADLSDPHLESKEFSMRFALRGESYKFGSLITDISDNSYHEFNFAEIGRTYKLRLLTNTTYSVTNRMSKATLRFADDFPLNGYTYSAPSSTITFPNIDKYSLDSTDLNKYGVFVKQGTLASFKKVPTVKSNLSRNIATINGVLYDDSKVTFKSNDISMYMLMRASTATELWNNYDALLYDLSKAGKRTSHCDDLGQDFPCYYKSSTVTEFEITGKIWLAFTVTLTCTDFSINDAGIIK